MNIVEVRSGDAANLLGRDVGWSRGNRGDEVMRRLVESSRRSRWMSKVACYEVEDGRDEVEIDDDVF